VAKSAEMTYSGKESKFKGGNRCSAREAGGQVLTAGEKRCELSDVKGNPVWRKEVTRKEAETGTGGEVKKSTGGGRPTKKGKNLKPAPASRSAPLPAPG